MDVFKKYKNIIISSICIFILCITCFFTGLGIGKSRRLTGIEYSSTELEQRINEGRDTASNILDSANTAGALTGGIESSNRAINEGMATIKLSAEQLYIFYTEVKRAIEIDKARTDRFQQLHSEFNATSVDALEIAIQHSKQYEQLILSLQQALGNITENNN